MKPLLLISLLPLGAFASPFVLVSPKAPIWSGIPDSFSRNLDKEADRICDGKLGTKARRIGEYGTFENLPYYYLTGTYECSAGPFTARTVCGPFGGCVGEEGTQIDEMANLRCRKEDYKGATRLSDYVYKHPVYSATYECTKKKE